MIYMVVAKSPFSSILKVQKLTYHNCASCRGDNGELRLGIRRAVRPRNGLPESVLAKQNSFPNALSLVANAVSTKKTFNVFYSPR